jgi:hypothetical protein
MDAQYAGIYRDEGRSTTGLERAAGRGELRRVRPGAYVDDAEWLASPSREQHLVRMMAAARSLSGGVVFSHESAAAWWGFPRVGPLPALVDVSFDSDAGRSKRVGVRWHRATWEPDDVLRAGHLLVTSPRRTAIDLARSRSLADGVIALDHVFALDVDRDEVASWVTRRRPFRGVRALAAALEIARGASESPLESLSLARFAQLGAPSPVQQHTIVTQDRRQYRVDFFWPELGVVGECDGRSKYVTPDDLWNEKRREDAIRPLVHRFVRWSWADALHSAPLAALLGRAGIPLRH